MATPWKDFPDETSRQPLLSLCPLEFTSQLVQAAKVSFAPSVP